MIKVLCSQVLRLGYDCNSLKLDKTKVHTGVLISVRGVQAFKNTWFEELKLKISGNEKTNLILESPPKSLTLKNATKGTKVEVKVLYLRDYGDSESSQ